MAITRAVAAQSPGRRSRLPRPVISEIQSLCCAQIVPKKYQKYRNESNNIEIYRTLNRLEKPLIILYFHYFLRLAFLRCFLNTVEVRGSSPLSPTISHLPCSNEVFTERFRMAVNYGIDRVRFPLSVRAGSRVRNRAVLKSIEEPGFRPGLGQGREHPRSRRRGEAGHGRRRPGPDLSIAVKREGSRSLGLPRDFPCYNASGLLARRG